MGPLAFFLMETSVKASNIEILGGLLIPEKGGFDPTSASRDAYESWAYQVEYLNDGRPNGRPEVFGLFFC